MAADINIYGTLKNATPNGTVATADQIRDEAEGKMQSEINSDFKERIASLESGGGTGGTDDYNELDNKPSINNVPLEGSKSLDDLGIQKKGDYATKDELKNATPSIGENGNWYIGGSDTGRSSKGADGVSLGEVALVQETGTGSGSEKRVMSQKAVTEKLSELGEKITKNYNIQQGQSLQTREDFRIPESRKATILIECEEGILKDDFGNIVTDKYTAFTTNIPINEEYLFTFPDDGSTTFGINVQGSNAIGTGTVTITVQTGLYSDINELGKDLKQDLDNTKNDLDSAKNDLSLVVNGIQKEISSVNRDVLISNTYNYLGKAGNLISAEKNYIVTSDFIEIPSLVKINIIAVFYNAGLYSCVSFYKSNAEESFISSLSISTETITGLWLKYEGEITIPDGAKYMRISGNTALVKESPEVTFTKYKVKQESIYADAPSGNTEYFIYPVDTGTDDIEDSGKAASVVGASKISDDNGVIMLPERYDKNGMPTKLVIYNHGAGGRVTDTYSKITFSSFAKLLTKKGYAVMEINGVPENMRNENYMSVADNGSAAHMGGWVFLRSLANAYKYVTEKYNIERDGCFVIGQSMGGITSLNVALSGIIPVKALALDAPVISAFHDAYFGGGWSSGTLGGSTPAIFAWIYQWDYCDSDNNTYTIPAGEYDIYGQSYSIEEEYEKTLNELKDNSQDMAILWHLNINKMYGYDAYKTGDFLIKNLDGNEIYDLNKDNDDKYFGKKLPCPCKIWFGSGDNVNNQDIAHRFIQKYRNAGSIIMFRTCPTTRHCVWDELEKQPDNTDISVVEDGITCSPYAVELWNWLKRYDGIK